LRRQRARPRPIPRRLPERLREREPRGELIRIAARVRVVDLRRPLEPRPRLRRPLAVDLGLAETHEGGADEDVARAERLLEYRQRSLAPVDRLVVPVLPPIQIAEIDHGDGRMRALEASHLLPDGKRAQQRLLRLGIALHVDEERAEIAELATDAG